MLVIINGRVVTPRAVLDGHCVVCEGRTIQRIAPQAQVLWPDDTTVVDAHGDFVAPGLIDLHVHGALGHDALNGSVEALAQIARYQVRGGTTAFTPTIASAPVDRTVAALAAVGQAMGHNFGGAQILGAHLEGPYLSPAQCGAQSPAALRLPVPAEYLPWLDSGFVTQMTLAPELPGALELVDALNEHELIASAGHTNATYAEIQAGLDRGLAHATHCFNCMSAMKKEGVYRVPGALETLLTDDRVMIELIADGHHVHPRLLRLAVRAAGPDRVCLITDATAGAGLPDGESFTMGDTSAVVRGGVALLADGSALAGSVATMMKCVRTLVQSAGVNLPDAVRMASLNPARALGLNCRKGSLEPCKDADVVVFSNKFAVRHTIVAGRVEFSAV